MLDFIFRILGNCSLSSFLAAKCHHNHLCMMFGFVKDGIPRGQLTSTLVSLILVNLEDNLVKLVLACFKHYQCRISFVNIKGNVRLQIPSFARSIPTSKLYYITLFAVTNKINETELLINFQDSINVLTFIFLYHLFHWCWWSFPCSSWGFHNLCWPWLSAEEKKP